MGATEINSSSDKKTAVYALLDKIEFPRDKYRLGHTLGFFSAGALAFLEENRDGLVIKLLRFMQGEVFKKIRNKVYEQKRDQRELINVCQRNFRKYMSLRDWGWFVIIQRTRPLIGKPDPTEELRLLEEKVKETYGAYTEQLETKARLMEDNTVIEEDKKALMKQLDKEQGNMSQYHEKQALMNSKKGELEVELTSEQEKLANREQSRVQALGDKKELELETVEVKKDIGGVEMSIQKLEQAKSNRDHTIKSLNEEIGDRDAVINKLNKEKKHINENNAKAIEDLAVATEKVEHLTRIKSKLESTLDELESSAANEKRAKATIEKDRRKIELELKITQENISELERSCNELKAQIERKDSDMLGQNGKLEDEQSLVGKTQKNIKELQGRLETLEEELDAERQARSKAERQRSDCTRELESLSERLDQASGATAAQMELNKKRDVEVIKLHKDLEESKIQGESSIAGMKRKQTDSVSEMTGQIDQLTKMKSK